MVNPKCKNCGKILTFNPQSQLLVCDSCKSETNFNKRLQTKKYTYNPNLGANINNKLDSINSCTHCQSIFTLNKNAPKKCPNCGSNDITINADLQHMPDNIIPFTVSQEQTIISFNKWLKKNWLAPSNFKKLAKQHNLVKMYYPCWVYDCHSNFNCQGIAEKDHTKTKTINTANGGHQTKTYTTTTTHSFNNSFECDYLNTYVSASNIIQSSFLNNFSGYDLTQMVGFCPEYLFGAKSMPLNKNAGQAYQDFENCIQTANNNKAKAQLLRNYDRIRTFYSKTIISNITTSSVYLPVYLTSYNYKNQNYNLYINGQTGCINGKSPKSVLKLLLLTFSSLAVIGTIIFLLLWLATL